MILHIMHSPKQQGMLIADPALPQAPTNASNNLGKSIVTLLIKIAAAYHEMDQEFQKLQHPIAQPAQTLSSWQNP